MLVKKSLYILLGLACLLINGLGAATIYEIQYTTNPGTGNYPSDYAGQYVTTQGIVTATGYAGNNGYYISMPEGGAWKGLLVYDDGNSPTPGSLIAVTGQVWEYYGLTEIRNVSFYELISGGNPIPPAAVITTSQAGDEEFEGVLMKVQNAVVTQAINQYGEWHVSDGSGEVEINDAFFDQTTLGVMTSVGVLFDSIVGVGNYSYGTHSLNPRSAADLLISSQGVVITLPHLQVASEAQVTVAVNVSNLTLAQGFQSYHLNLSYDPGILTYNSYGTAGTLSANGTVMVTPSMGSLSVNYVGNGYLLGQGTLLNLNFSATGDGVSDLTATDFTFNTTPVMLINQGLVTVGNSGGEVIDTLSVIQRPLLNIPAIVIPGESFEIECVAPSTTTGWAASLAKGNLNHSLNLVSTQYVSDPPRWILTAQVPDVNVFELYDLRVTANGGISDRTKHSVQVLPTRKTSYYFAHVTDVHMPTHIFYPDNGYDTDSTETVDLREVINDINVIRPEFILLTGDLVNQGELEEYENLRVYSKAKRLLGEFEVPVYLVAGNHDIGGWTSTAPPAGSARKFWWKNFGWSWLNNTSVSWSYHTQDYSFDYGPVHYVGLEGYDNYDNYLPSIYGDTSFTAAQMQWLQADLTASTAETKVLFHHYDFADQLNLNSLGLDMSLWGHIHYDSGSITATPYSLATDATCDGGRAYRMIRVNGTAVQPFATLHSGSTGSQIHIDFIPNNYGYADSVRASVVNNQPFSFENAVVKFKMPPNSTDYTVTGGVLEQVDSSGDFNICYVRVSLAANSTVTATLKANSTHTEDDSLPAVGFVLNSAYPNPFRESLSLNLSLAKSGALAIRIYNLKGELVNTVFQGRALSGNAFYYWSGTDLNGRKCPNGIYLLRLTSGDQALTRKVILLK
jgi:hypothetical protein